MTGGGTLTTVDDKEYPELDKIEIKDLKKQIKKLKKENKLQRRLIIELYKNIEYNEL